MFVNPSICLSQAICHCHLLGLFQGIWHPPTLHAAVQVGCSRPADVTKLRTRGLERAYRHSQDPASLEAWCSQFKRQRELYKWKFVEYWSRKISNSNGNTKTLWSHLRCLLSQPIATSMLHSPDEFANYFCDKIDRVRLLTSDFDQPIIDSRLVSDPLSNFTAVKVNEITTMIRKAPAKQCLLDPLPTWLLKSVSNTLSPVIVLMCKSTPPLIIVNSLQFISRLLCVLYWKRPPWTHPIWALSDQYPTSASFPNCLNVSSIPELLIMPTLMVSFRLFSQPTADFIQPRQPWWKYITIWLSSWTMVMSALLPSLVCPLHSILLTTRFCWTLLSVGLL